MSQDERNHAIWLLCRAADKLYLYLHLLRDQNASPERIAVWQQMLDRITDERHTIEATSHAPT